MSQDEGSCPKNEKTDVLLSSFIGNPHEPGRGSCPKNVKLVKA